MKKLKVYQMNKEFVQKTFHEVLAEMRGLEILDGQIPDEVDPTIRFFRKVHTLGTHYPPKYYGRHAVSLNEAFLSGYMSPETLRSTLVHEIIHMFPKCNNHSPLFQKWARILGNRFGMKLGTHSTKEEGQELQRAYIASAKNIGVCIDCGNYFLSPNMSQDVKAWKRHGSATYRCRCSHGKENILVIKYGGVSLVDGKFCEDAIRERARKWLEKHVPPESYRKEHPFSWTPEAIELENWWEEDTPPVLSAPILEEDSSAWNAAAMSAPRLLDKRLRKKPRVTFEGMDPLF